MGWKDAPVVELDRTPAWARAPLADYESLLAPQRTLPSRGLRRPPDVVQQPQPSAELPAGPQQARQQAPVQSPPPAKRKVKFQGAIYRFPAEFSDEQVGKWFEQHLAVKRQASRQADPEQRLADSWEKGGAAVTPLPAATAAPPPVPPPTGQADPDRQKRTTDAAESIAERLSSTASFGLGEHMFAANVPADMRPAVLDAIRRRYATDQTMKKAGYGVRAATSAVEGAIDFARPLAKAVGALPPLDPDQERFRQEMLAVRQEVDPTVRPDTPAVGRWAQQAGQMAFPMIQSIGLGRAAGGAAGLAGAGAKATAAAVALGTSGSFLPQIADDTYTQLIGEGVSPSDAKIVTAIAAPVEAAVESFLPDPFKGMSGPLRGTARQVARKVAGEFAKRYGAELSEEIIQGAVREVGSVVASQMDELVPDKGLGSVFPKAVDAGIESAGPLLLMMAPGGAKMTAEASVGSAGRRTALKGLRVERADAQQDAADFFRPESVASWVQAHPDAAAEVAKRTSDSRFNKTWEVENGFPKRSTQPQRKSFADMVRGVLAQPGGVRDGQEGDATGGEQAGVGPLPAGSGPAVPTGDTGVPEQPALIPPPAVGTAPGAAAVPQAVEESAAEQSTGPAGEGGVKWRPGLTSSQGIEADLWDSATARIPEELIRDRVKTFGVGEITGEPGTSGKYEDGAIVVDGSDVRTTTHEVAHAIELGPFGDLPEITAARIALRDVGDAIETSPRDRVTNLLTSIWSGEDRAPELTYLQDNLPDVLRDVQRVTGAAAPPTDEDAAIDDLFAGEEGETDASAVRGPEAKIQQEQGGPDIRGPGEVKVPAEPAGEVAPPREEAEAEVQVTPEEEAEAAIADVDWTTQAGEREAMKRVKAVADKHGINPNELWRDVVNEAQDTSRDIVTELEGDLPPSKGLKRQTKKEAAVEAARNEPVKPSTPKGPMPAAMETEADVRAAYDAGQIETDEVTRRLAGIRAKVPTTVKTPNRGQAKPKTPPTAASPVPEGLDPVFYRKGQEAGKVGVRNPEASGAKPGSLPWKSWVAGNESAKAKPSRNKPVSPPTAEVAPAGVDAKVEDRLNEEERKLWRSRDAEEKRMAKRRRSGMVPPPITEELQGKSETRIAEIDKRIAEIRTERQGLYEAARNKPSEPPAPEPVSSIATGEKAGKQAADVVSSTPGESQNEPGQGPAGQPQAEPGRPGPGRGNRPPLRELGATGKRGRLNTASGKVFDVEYIAVEAEDLIPSHDARRNFTKNEGGDANERPYHDPKEGMSSRLAVQQIAEARDDKLSLLVSDNETPTDGPPMVVEDGAVLGGNARTQGIQLGYFNGGEPATKFKQLAIASAQKFGIDPARVEGMKQPIIVRVLEGVTDRGEMSRLLNRPLTTGKSAATEAVSVGARISQDTAETVSSMLEPRGEEGAPSLRDTLADKRKSGKLVSLLQTDGAWGQEDVDRYVNPNTGDLNDAGKAQIEEALLGRIVADPKVVGGMTPGERRMTLSSLGPLVRLTSHPKHGKRAAEIVRLAVEAFPGYKAADRSVRDYFLRQTSMLEMPGQGDEAVAAVVNAMDTRGPRGFKTGLEDVLDSLNIKAKQKGLFASEIKKTGTIEEAIAEVFPLPEPPKKKGLKSEPAAAPPSPPTAPPSPPPVAPSPAGDLSTEDFADIFANPESSPAPQSSGPSKGKPRAKTQRKAAEPNKGPKKSPKEGVAVGDTVKTDQYGDVEILEVIHKNWGLGKINGQWAAVNLRTGTVDPLMSYDKTRILDTFALAGISQPDEESEAPSSNKAKSAEASKEMGEAVDRIFKAAKGDQPGAAGLNRDMIVAIADLMKATFKKGRYEFAAFIDAVVEKFGRQFAIDNATWLRSKWDKLRVTLPKISESRDIAEMLAEKAPVEEPVTPQAEEPAAEKPKPAPAGDGGETTGTKNAKTDELREKAGFSERVMENPESIDEWQEEAARLIAKDPKMPFDLAAELAETPRNLSPREEAVLNRHIRNLENKRRAGEDVQDELLTAIEASERVGRLWGQAGVLLPIWDRLPGTHPKIMRALTVDGETVLGITIPTTQVDAVLRALGAEVKQGNVDETIAKVLAGDAKVQLTNGWEIERSKVQGERRLEITGPSAAHHSQLERAGAILERIGFKYRYFIPTGETMRTVWDAVTKGRPVAKVESFDGQELAAPDAGKGKGAGPARRGGPNASIPVSPTPVGKTPSTGEVVRQISEAFSVPVRTGHFVGPHTGIYKQLEDVARTKGYGNIAVATHEVAHHLDRTEGVLANWRAVPAAARDELKALDYQPSRGDIHEGFAEYIRHLLTMDDAATVAPQFDAWFNTWLTGHPDAEDALYTSKAVVDQWRQAGSLARVEAQIDMGESLWQKVGKGLRHPIGTIRTVKDWINDNWINRLAPLLRVSKQMVGAGTSRQVMQKMAGDYNFWAFAKVSNMGAASKARAWAETGVADVAGNRLGPGLRETLAPIAKELRDKDTLRQFYAYAYARHALDVLAQGKEPGILKTDAQNVVAQFDSRPGWKDAADGITAWHSALVDYLVDAGGLSQEVADEMRAMYPNFISLARKMDSDFALGAGGGGARYANLPSGVMRLKGSGREIQPPLESALAYAERIIGIADKVRVGRMLVEASEKYGTLGDTVEKVDPKMVPTSARLESLKDQLEKAGADLSTADMDALLTIFSQDLAGDPKDNIVVLWRNGKRELYYVRDDLYRALTAYDKPFKLPAIVDQTAGRVARMIRLGATGVRAGFSLLTNPLRDVQTAMMQTEYQGRNPLSIVANTIGGFVKDIAGSEVAQIWKRGGGPMAQPLGIDRAFLKEAINELTAQSPKDKALNWAKHPVHSLRSLFSLPEAAPRLAEFEAALRAEGWRPGMNVTFEQYIKAQLAAANVTVDFREGGTLAMWLNQLVPFFNAGIQGQARIASAIRNRPIATTVTGLLWMTLPALALWWKQKDEEWYKKLTPMEKSRYWHVKIPGTETILRIPKPFEWGHLFASMPEAAMESAYRKNPQAFTEEVGVALDDMTPNIIPGILEAPIEVAANRDFFRDAPLVSERLQNVRPEDQHTPSTTETAKMLGRITGLSPIKVEHLAEGWTGGLATDLVKGVESTVGATTHKTTRQIVGGASALPVVGRLFLSPTHDRAINDFYTKLEQAEQDYGSARLGKKKSTTPANLHRFRQAAEKLSNLRAASRLILEDKTLKDEQKRARFMEIQERMSKIANNAMGRE